MTEAGRSGAPSRTVSRMPEEKQDPANTQMFRAFVERGEQEGGRSGSRTVVWMVVGALAALVILVVVILAT